ncbi:VOC family protein [Siphonobacter aquaeclarae]|jgi:PhnB protein|uniref:PhnB protein n=1 Tax=Siphonobacter aquaeclarae TaxID=563176 RepID=A0A1G9KJI7_9BACT|nr:VOC family protein [Siphonobacter aquaeclarae]SDL49677.1 PhnB protein [Siphonobacter aquaeclarae]
MAEINAYLTFHGNCLEAMTFYQACFGGEFDSMTYENSPMKVPVGKESKIMHSRLQSEALELMAADDLTAPASSPGNMVSLNVNCRSEEEIKRLFKGISQGGKVTLPLQDTFWGAKFGMVTDRFGIKWMFNYGK